MILFCVQKVKIMKQNSVHWS